LKDNGSWWADPVNKAQQLSAYFKILVTNKQSISSKHNGVQSPKNWVF